MKQFFITGTSSGIGKALAEKALDEGHKVTGISRRNRLEHPNYRHLVHDLADYDNYHLVNFNINHEADELVLVNNAGWLGEVKPTARMNPTAIEQAYQINLIAPSILCRLFLDQTENNGQKRTVINISSGAAKYPVSSWSTYCASKAGLDLFTQVMAKDHPDVRCLAIAPGIVDTEMQGEIRRIDSGDFPDVDRFKRYKEEGELSAPGEVAQKLMDIIAHPEKAPDIVFSLRDI